jgi:sporulation protein YlmC with PRC-barrel domain
MAGVTAGGLLRTPVRLHGIQLGHVADLVLDVERRRVLGLEVACGDDERRFLPLAVATVAEEDVRVSSPLVLLNESELSFYTTRGSTFRSLRGTSVVRARETLGRLDDLVLGDDARIVRVVVDGNEISYTAAVRLGASGTNVRRAS